MEKLSKIITVLGYLDYVLSTSVLAYGLYSGSWLYIAAGALGLVLAYLKPAERLKNRLASKFIRKPVLSALPAAEEASVALPHLPPVNSTPAYLPRTKYPATRYFLSYYAPQATQRQRVVSPRDVAATLHVPASRWNPGVRAVAVKPPQPRKRASLAG